MGKIGDLWVKLKLKSDEYKKGLDEAQGKTRSFSDKIKSLSVTAKAIWGAIGISAAKLAGDFIKSSQTIGDAWDKTMTRLTTKWQAVVAEFNRSLAGSGTESFGQQLARGFMGPIWGTLFGPNSKRAGLAGKSLSEAKDTMTEIEYAFRLTMAQSGPKLHELYLKMMNTALSASEREAAAKDYRKEVEDIYAPRVKGIKDVMDKTAQQYLAIGGISPDKYSTDKVLELIKMMGSDPDKVEREYSDFFAGYQSIGDDISGNLVNTMEAYYNATNEMNDILKRADRTAQSMEKTGLDDIIKKLGEGLEEAAAAGGAGLVQEDVADSAVLNLKALHVLTADVDNKIHVGQKMPGGGEVGHGLHHAVVGVEGIFRQVLAVAGGGDGGHMEGGVVRDFPSSHPNFASALTDTPRFGAYG